MGAAASAQDVTQGGAPSGADASAIRAGARRVTIVRTEDPPDIDGVLDDGAWANATVIDNLTQIEPTEGAAPSERTEVLLLFDSEFVYIGIRCFDREPDKIRATVMQRDRSLGADDRVAVVFDTFFDKRNAFFFEMNAVGAKRDALIENNNSFRADWDGIWYGKSSINESGWVVEMAIPAKTISFDENSNSWGFNVERVIRRRNEILRWAAVSQNKNIRSIGDAGEIEGIAGMEQGVGIDFKPFTTMRYAPDESAFELDAGADLFYRITPSLALAVTVNTDFAETEVDERRVNLTRFPLFFPEKRDFFLQDADIFAFGGIRRNPLPFNSRRIGLGPGGAPVDLIGGVRLSGRVGDLNMAFLDVQTKSFAGIESKNLGVGRVSYNVLDESSVGAIFTAGDPVTNDDNVLGGLDFKYRNSQVDGDQVFEAHGWLMKTHTSGVNGDDFGFGGRLNWPNDRIDAGLGMFYIPENLNPALGFISRRGIREYFGNARYRWRPGNGIRTIDTGFRGSLVTQMDNSLESVEMTVNLIEIELDSSDEFELQYEYGKEVLLESFNIRDDIVVPMGTYQSNRFEASARTSIARPISGRASLSVGDFWNGTRTATNVSAEWRPSRYFFLSGEFENNDIELEGGAFNTNLVRARMNVQFSPDLSWNTFAQYDNDSDSIGINSRVRWIVEPGSEVNFVINQTLDLIDSRIERGDTELVGKVSWTFRY